VHLTGPYEYELAISPQTFSVIAADGTAKFSGVVTSRYPKLYIVSVDARPIYVGITRQPIRSRLRLGWNATGAHGCYGNAWRHELTAAHLDVLVRRRAGRR
jgi:hypothetical protein